MIIHEVNQMIEVDTPKGKGRIWLVTEYGSEIEKIYTVITNDGEFWEFPPENIKATMNLTMGRGKWQLSSQSK